MQTELNKVVTALQEFYAREAFLLEKDLGERALTHRLAVHFEKQFSGWEVDCDYDRLGERTLRLPHGSIVSTDDHLGKSIYPDIVVHQREIPNNLLAVEVRKSANHQPLGARPAQAAGADRSASVVRLLDRRAADARQEAGHDVGSLYRRRDRPGPVRLVRRAAEGCGLERRMKPAKRRFIDDAHTIDPGDLPSVAIAQHALAQQARAQAASAPDLEAILANPKIVKTLDDIKADDARTLCRTEAHHRNPGAALQGKGPRRILPEADAGTRLQGRCRSTAKAM